MNTLKISIITVCHNSIDTIERSIQSLVGQKYPNMEYIIIDGNSTDGTQDIIRKYEKNIQYWVSEPDSGIYNAMNKGISVATGDIIAFLNSDDWYEDGALEYVAAYFQNNRTQILCGADIIWENGKGYKRKIEDKEELKVRMIYCHQAIFARKNVFNEYGNFKEKYKIAADYEWLLRSYYAGVSIENTEKVLVNFSRGGISSTNRLECSKEVREIALDALQKQTGMELLEKQCLKQRIIDNHEYIENSYWIKIGIEENAFKNIALKCASRKVLGESATFSIFGCGEVGLECLKLLQELDISPVCFWDNGKAKWGTKVQGIAVKNPNEIKKTDSIVLIASTLYETEIKEQLEQMGLLECKGYICYTKLRSDIGKVVKEMLKER